jgi:hypothetical protein
MKKNLKIFKNNKPFSDTFYTKFRKCDTTNAYNITNVDNIYNKTTKNITLAQNPKNISYITQRNTIRNNPIILNCAYNAITELQKLNDNYKYPPTKTGSGNNCPDIIAYSYTWPLNMWQYVKYVYTLGITDTDKTIINPIDDSIHNMCSQYIYLMIKAELYPICNDRYNTPYYTKIEEFIPNDFADNDLKTPVKKIIHPPNNY